MNKIGLKSYISGLIVIFILMILCYILTFIIPSGICSTDATTGVTTLLDAANNLTFGKWLLSPILVLTIDGSATIIAVIAFLLVIGGIFEVLNGCNLVKYMLDKITYKYGSKKYLLQVILIVIFMSMGAFVGSFEEVVPLVPIIVGLSISLGWDAFTGLSMSIIATGCGFASGVMNPFTVGVAQTLAGVPMFSGVWLRLVCFVLILALLLLFTRIYSKKIDKNIDFTLKEFTPNKDLDKALLAFVIILLIGIICIISSSVITALQDYTTIIVAVMFLTAGITSSILAKVPVKKFLKQFGFGVLSILPAVLMILMASSIKYTLTQSNILDTIMYSIIQIANKIPSFAVILLIYFVVLVMNFFIASGSAKAFLLIPLIKPIAMTFGISANLYILAFAFGDGFSNVFYPTNPALLIALGVSDISYGQYAKKAWKFQVANLVLTSALLLLGLVIGY